MIPAALATAGAWSRDLSAIVRLRVVLVFVLVGSLGCQSRASTGPDDPVTLSIGYAAPTNETGEITGIRDLVSIITTERLTRSGAHGRHEPQLAERWSVEAGGRQLTFTLRQGVQFHDGTPLTPKAVAASLEAARTDPVHLAQHPTLADIERIDALEPDTVMIALRRPSLLVLEEGVPITKLDPQGRRVGTGPFVLNEQSDHATTLKANSSYYRGRPRIDVIRIQTYETLRAAWAAMMRGEIDFLYEVPIRARDFVARESRIGVFPFERSYAYAVEFNTTRPIFRHAPVRIALNHAVDRAALIRQTLEGYGSIASGIWPAHWAYDGVDRAYRYDPQLADRMLSQSGFPRPNAPLSRTDAMPSRLSFVCLVPLNVGPLERIALEVQKQLSDIGVDMKIEGVPYEEFARKMSVGEYDALLLWRNTGRSLPRLYLWHSSQNPAATGYRSTDDALDQLRLAGTEEAVREAAARFQRALYEDPPAIFLASRPGARAVSRRFEVPTAADQDIIEAIWQWRPRIQDRAE